MIAQGMYDGDMQALADKSGARVEIVSSKTDVHHQFAQDIANFLKHRNKLGLDTAFILPVGPVKQYPILADICNRERISWKRVHTFNMDEYLDWQGRAVDESHPLSFAGYMKHQFFALLDPDLTIPEDQVHFPDPLNIEAFSEKIEQLGGIDCCYGGIGIHGHVAFNEPMDNLFYQVSVSEFKASKTRILHLNKETIVMNCSRSGGGMLSQFPFMAITIGMKDILASRRIRLFCDGGEWQKTAVRHAVAGEPGVQYPVSLLRGHADYVICMDAETAEPVTFHI